MTRGGGPGIFFPTFSHLKPLLLLSLAHIWSCLIFSPISPSPINSPLSLSYHFPMKYDDAIVIEIYGDSVNLHMTFLIANTYLQFTCKVIIPYLTMLMPKI